MEEEARKAGARFREAAEALLSILYEEGAALRRLDAEGVSAFCERKRALVGEMGRRAAAWSEDTPPDPALRTTLEALARVNRRNRTLCEETLGYLGDFLRHAAPCVYGPKGAALPAPLAGYALSREA